MPRLTLCAVQGSATGAYSPLRATSKPSFVLMDVDGARVRHWFSLAAPREGCAFAALPVADVARLLVAAGGVCVPAGGWRGEGGQDRVHEAANHRRKARMSSATEDALLWVTFFGAALGATRRKAARWPARQALFSAALRGRPPPPLARARARQQKSRSRAGLSRSLASGACAPVRNPPPAVKTRNTDHTRLLRRRRGLGLRGVGSAHARGRAF